MSETAAQRGRPRDSDVDKRVLDAAWDLLDTVGYAGLHVDEVAERAGAAKTTVYRRWPTKDHLAAALAVRILADVPIEDTGDVRHDLTRFATTLAVNLNRLRLVGHGPGDEASAGLAAEIVAALARHADLGDMARPLFARRHELVLARLASAREREGLRADLDPQILVDQIAGPLYYRVLITGAPVGRGYAEHLVSAVLDGAFTGAAPPGEEG
ncbi:MAG TPA: TetR/AcrR family transcriptional regulator [Streptosporangiaceae bacterium]